jgi:hypothetical protein
VAIKGYLRVYHQVLAAHGLDEAALGALRGS